MPERGPSKYFARKENTTPNKKNHLAEHVDEVCRREILRRLNQTVNGKRHTQKQVAKSLGITRSYLIKIMNQLGIHNTKSQSA